MKRTLLSAVTLTLIASIAGAATPVPAMGKASAAGATSGITTDYIDASVRAQDDLFAHLNGNWLKNTEIPADKSSWGTFAQLDDAIQPKLLAIIENAAKDGHKAAGSDAQKVGDLYASFMDEAKIEALGLTPLQGEMAKIAALSDKSGIPALIARLGKLGVNTPYDFGIHQDAKDSTRYVADLSQGGLGMPDRDYYLKTDDTKLAATRAAYQVHVANMLTLAGDKDAAANAKSIVEFETELARVQWSRVENRDPVKTYNKVELTKLTDMAPGYDWAAYLSAAGIAGKTDYVIVSQPSYLKGMTDLLAKTPLTTIQAYFQWHLVRAYAGLLPKAFVEENFAFSGTTLTGAKEMRPRWKRGVERVEGALGEVIGKLYVEQNFPAERKVRMEALVKNLMIAFKQSINKLDWMSATTKKQAQTKLAKFTTKIGYPNRWRDYSALVIARDDLVGNVMRSRAVDSDKEVAKLGKPIDREEWGMTPQTVNAYYNPEMNEIVFPASILQPPFFDINADDAVNYGAIGAVIGHEISHGFDDQGAQYDGDGNLRDWWGVSDHQRFAAKTSMLVAQYSAYSPIPGYKVNGELTLGENIADNSGLAVAYKAYQLSLKGKKAPVIDGMSGDQRFLMGWSQVWRMKMRDQQQIVQLTSDPHSPGKVRVNGTIANMPVFYHAFGVKPGDKMYLPPKQRVSIW